MGNDPLGTAFVIHLTLTPAILLDVVATNVVLEHWIAALDTALQETFGMEYSYRRVRRTHRITQIGTEVDDERGTYLTIRFERLTPS